MSCNPRRTHLQYRAGLCRFVRSDADAVCTVYKERVHSRISTQSPCFYSISDFLNKILGEVYEKKLKEKTHNSCRTAADTLIFNDHRVLLMVDIAETKLVGFTVF